MTKAELVTVKDEDWYKQLVFDIKKMEFAGIVVTKWNQGKRILQDILKFEKAEYGNKTVDGLARDLKASRSDLYACVQFARDYELSDDVGRFEGKSWRWVVHELLPEHRSREVAPFPPGSFSVIYADPPWEYDFSESDGRSIEAHYPTMTVDQIKAIPIQPTEDAILFLWATAPKLTEALEVMTAWQFTYKTNAVWDKEKIGMGYWFRGQHEHLLLGTKGRITPPAEAERVASVIRLARTEHSRKPSVIPELIERWYPNQHWIELFARGKTRDGWVSWGLDAN